MMTNKNNYKMIRELMARRIDEATENRIHHTGPSDARKENDAYWLGRIEQCNEILSLLDGKIIVRS